MGMEYSRKLTLNLGWKVKGQLVVIWMSPEDFVFVDLGQGKMVKRFLHPVVLMSPFWFN